MANVFSTIPLMIGRRAEQEAISRILRIAIQHDDKIKHIDHMMVYHLGERALVELHVVLDEHLPLKLTHDLTEALERKVSKNNNTCYKMKNVEEGVLRILIRE